MHHNFKLMICMVIYMDYIRFNETVQVERERAKDAALGVKTAIVLDGYVKRKVIKQTVMTTVYGVTRFGARLQIAKQLKGKFIVL